VSEQDVPSGSAAGLWWRNPAYRLIVALGGALFRVLGLRRTVQGTEHVPAEGGAVLAISHFSYLDFALAEWAVWRDRRRYTRFLATAASFRHPVAGPLMRSMGHIPVHRDAGAGALDAAVDALRRGEVVGVFPESRVSASFTLLPFKTGAVRMAAAAGVPVVPCVIWGSHRVMTRSHPTSLWRSRRTPVTIVLGEPVHVGPDEQPEVATEVLRARMVQLLEQAMDGYPDVPGPGAWWAPAHRGGGAPPAGREDREAV
jgi:1-acyl-sn-glycerol-3-phosphate acyltransferase